jgi:hypothetical protein
LRESREPETWELSDEEFQAVSGLPPGERYNHLVKRVADWQWIWVLEDDSGLAGSADEQGRRYLPTWPHARYAEAAAIDEWAGTRPNAVEIHEWVENVLPGVAEKEGMIAAFPTPGDQGFIVPPLGMKADIEEELTLYEPA